MKTSKHIWVVFVILLFILAIAIRIAAISAQNADTNDFNQWYQVLAKRGPAALSTKFATYTPPYLFLLWLGTLLKAILPPLYAIKIIPILFDALSAFAVYKLVRLRYTGDHVPWLAAAAFLLLPTVVLNSAYWGQIDSLYTSFLLWCIYFILTDRPLPALLSFGISFSIKAQAVFLAPFLAVMAFKKRVPWVYFLIPALVYAITAILPALAAGRPLVDTVNIYVSQVKAYPQLAMHAANLYSIVPYRFAQAAYYGGLAVAAILLGAWTLYYGLRKFELTPRAILLTALLSLVLVPFLLPKMHDRYFYPADNLSYVMIFFVPAYGIVAAGYQLISGLVYYIFLHSVTPEQNLFMLRSAVLLNTLLVSGLVVHQLLFFVCGTKGRPLVERQDSSS